MGHLSRETTNELSCIASGPGKKTTVHAEHCSTIEFQEYQHKNYM